MEVLKITNLKKRFGEKEVLKGLNLSINEHSVYGFVGLNGAGKTTTMKAILGLLKIDEGEIEVLGEKVNYGNTKTNRYIGYLPDVPEYYAFLNAKEYLNLCGESLGMDNKTIEKRTSELLTLVGLQNEHSKIKGYSRGMKQRLGIAQGLYGHPKLLICDEPTSALDPIGRKEILDILAKCKEETTVLFSTHILTDVERICTDVAFLVDGVIKIDGSIEELKNLHHTNEYQITLSNSKDNELLIKAFPFLKTDEFDNFHFNGNAEIMESILSFILQNHIKLKKIEQLDLTLEKLFLEVNNR